MRVCGVGRVGEQVFFFLGGGRDKNKEKLNFSFTTHSGHSMLFRFTRAPRSRKMQDTRNPVSPGSTLHPHTNL